MKPFWTVIGVCLMVLATAKGDNNDDSVTPFTIEKITKTAEDNPDVNVTVTVKPNTNVTEISYLILTIIRNSSSTEPEYTTQLTGVDTIESQSPTSLNFTVTSDIVKPGSATFIITAHDNASTTLAFGQVEFELTAIDPAIDWVGAANGADPKPSIRVKTDSDIILNDQPCPRGTTYLLEPSLDDPIEVCIERRGDQEDTPRFCDATIEVGEFIEIDSLSSIVLTYEPDGETISLEVKGTYLSDSSTMEIVFYDPDGDHNQTDEFNCTINNVEQSCKANGRSQPSVNQFNILFVAVNAEGKVTESTSKTRFEDYKTTGQALPTNLLEVGWAATDDGIYNISLAPEVPPLFSTVSIDCPGGQRCVSYFLNINELPYVASVKNETDDLNIVAATADMEISAIDLTVDKIVKKSVAGINSEVTLEVTVTPTSNISDVKDLTLVIVRTDEVSVTEVITKTAGMELTTESATPSFNVTEDAVRNGLTTFIIVAHNQSDVALAAGQVQFDLQEITAQINWVGAATGSTDPNPSLRVQTNISIVVDDQECQPGTTYFLEYSPPPENIIEVCLQAKNTRGNTSLFCDATIQVGEFTEIQPLTSVALIYETDVSTSLEVTGTYLENSTGMEIVFYDNSTSLIYNDALTCDINGNDDKTCKTDATSPYSGNPFNILLVALGNKGVVIESTSKTGFEDYKTTGQRLLSDLMEVGWTALANATYDIFLTPEVPLPFSTVSMDCYAAQRCISYFVNLTESSYVASVKNEADNVNIVAATVDMGSLVTTFTIHNITKTNITGSDVSVSVKVTPDSTVSSITDLTLVILRTDGDSVTQYFAHITDISSIEGSTPLNFSVQEEALASGLVTFIIVAHNNETTALAAGQVQLELQDINADINWVGAGAGAEESKPSLRVHTDVDILVDGLECKKDQTTYFLEYSQTTEPIQVCLSATSNQGDNTLFCDATIPVGNFIEIQDLKSIALIYAIDKINTSLEVKANYSDSSKTMEIVFYNKPAELIIYDDTFTCNINSTEDKTCKTDVISTPSGNPYNILFVAVDGDKKVTESTLKNGFEDYKTTAEALTEDLMQVDWTVNEFTNYHVSILPTDAAYSEVFVDCDKNPCIAYFLELKPNQEYVASVQKTNDNQNTVAATVLMTE